MKRYLFLLSFVFVFLLPNLIIGSTKERVSVPAPLFSSVESDNQQYNIFIEDQDDVLVMDIEEYDAGYDPTSKYSWNIEELPFVPNPFKYTFKKDPKTKKADAGIKKQFEIIKKLVHRDDIDAIINAGDSDREGEIIVRIILDNAKNTKPVN